jgi:hypothetical protein
MGVTTTAKRGDDGNAGEERRLDLGGVCVR